VVKKAKTVNRLQDIFTMFDVDESTQNMVYSFVCPSTNDIPRFPAFDANYLDVEIPFCDNDVLNHVARTSLAAAKSFYSATDRQDFCM